MRILTGILLGAMLAPAQTARLVNAQLPWHERVTDSHGKLLAWYQPERNLGYDQVLRLGWDFIEHKVPRDTRHKTGLKIYLINSVFNGDTLQGRNWQHNPAMVFASFVDSLLGWYPYSGDEQAIAVVREMLDHQLAHGTTPLDWEWPGVPFATNCDDEPDYGRCIQNLPRDFYGGIETDKIGELGTGYVLFYELTGGKKYLEAAIRCADALARHVRPGDAEHTPWPFRVDARNGKTLAREEFGGAVVSPVRLFDELIRIRQGNTEEYRKARHLAWQWILQHPLNRESPAWNKWTGYFEDVVYNPENMNQAAPGITALYLLTRPDPEALDPRWKAHAGQLIDWVRQRFGRGPFAGAWGIDEQGTADGRSACCSRAGLGSHTSRWAAVNALYAERTGDEQAREDAFRSLNYATYFAGSDGRIACCGDDHGNPYWFSDGYSDYLRHFSWVMGALPELAPVHADHLLRSSSVVRNVTYGTRKLSYRTFDAAATEVLRLSFRPERIRSGDRVLAERKDLAGEGYQLESLKDGDTILRIRHESAEVSVEAH